MPVLAIAPSDVTASIRAGAEGNGRVGQPSKRSKNTDAPRSAGVLSAIITQSALAHSGTYAIVGIPRGISVPRRRQVTWSGQLSTRWTMSVASTTNGMTAYFASPFDGIYKTTNGGSVMTRVQGGVGGLIAAISCSDDGSRVIIGTTESKTFASTDGGATFTQTTLAQGNRYVTGDGSFFVATNSDATCYTSTDGITWTLRNSTNPFGGVSQRQTIAGSATGSVLYSLSGATTLYKSITQGVTWTAITMPGTGKTIDCSADGTVIVVGTGNSDTKLIVSRDSGVTWSQTPLVSNTSGVDSISCSSSGDVIALTTETALVYAALDGETATLQTIPGVPTLSPNNGQGLAISVSGDGTRILAVLVSKVYAGTVA